MDSTRYSSFIEYHSYVRGMADLTIIHLPALVLFSVTSVLFSVSYHIIKDVYSTSSILTISHPQNWRMSLWS